MQTQSVQVKLTLPVQLSEFAKSKSRKFGLPLAAYIRHLIIEDVSDMEIPEFQASEKVEEAYKDAVENENKAVEVKDIDDFFKKL